eukprot:GHVR01147748.1.p1 GENE.GHVR01147748.1~~GHVR01147748.1.p1  ORF type:complete len:143 (+),score=73.99 GHVR01147748.1:116-544(+)
MRKENNKNKNNKNKSTLLFGEEDKTLSNNTKTTNISNNTTYHSNELTINEKYASKYEERKRKEELASGRHRYDLDEEDESDSETEDEFGYLLTDKVEKKVFETLAKIRNKDSVIYDNEVTFFTDDDFDDADTHTHTHTHTHI